MRAVERASSMPSPTDTRWTFREADRPRAIDRYIDYFGERLAAGGVPADDPCGERLLDALASQATPDRLKSPGGPCHV